MPSPAGRPSERILQGSIAGALLRLAGPVVLANVLQTVYQLTDTFWVGRLGTEAVAAVSFSFPYLPPHLLWRRNHDRWDDPRGAV
ncbi:MAG: MATE family efflux transporter [Rhodothermales bacterium]